ncbi:MAG: response regulator [Rubrivivax sp.]|nr:MAG: response regulator [Rubrivivax sp.]
MPHPDGLRQGFDRGLDGAQPASAMPFKACLSRVRIRFEEMLYKGQAMPFQYASFQKKPIGGRMSDTGFYNPSPRTDSRIKTRKVLVVDDNAEAADMLGAMLRFLGYDVRVGYDGEACLRLAEIFQPDMAVWDITMPGMSGHEAARRLRSLSVGRKLNLIALTEVPDQREALSCGFDHHMDKPVDMNALVMALGCA